MYIPVKCPHCDHINNISHEGGYLPKCVMCDDTADGGCGKFFVYELDKVSTQSYKIEGRD